MCDGVRLRSSVGVNSDINLEWAWALVGKHLRNIHYAEIKRDTCATNRLGELTRRLGEDLQQRAKLVEKLHKKRFPAVIRTDESSEALSESESSRMGVREAAIVFQRQINAHEVSSLWSVWKSTPQRAGVAFV